MGPDDERLYSIGFCVAFSLLGNVGILSTSIRLVACRKLVGAFDPHSRLAGEEMDLSRISRDVLPWYRHHPREYKRIWSLCRLGDYRLTL